MIIALSVVVNNFKRAPNLVKPKWEEGRCPPAPLRLRHWSILYYSNFKTNSIIVYMYIVIYYCGRKCHNLIYVVVHAIILSDSEQQVLDVEEMKHSFSKPLEWLNGIYTNSINIRITPSESMLYHIRYCWS